MNDFPQFRVVVPLYNKCAYIRRAVDSVLAQTLEDFELIVVDDGSTDGSIEALANIKDIRLQIIQQPNQGVGVARNTGMEMTRAKWIAFLDADDAWMPDHLRELSKISKLFPDVGLISTTCVEAFGNTLPDWQKLEVPSVIRKVDYFLEASKAIGFVNSTSSAVKREVYKKIGGFLLFKAGEDLEYWARIAIAHPVAISARVTCAYFRDTGGVMHELHQKASYIQIQPIRNLRDISPSVAMLCDHAENNPNLWKNPSIGAYVNSRLENGIRGALFHNEIGIARDFSKLMMQPKTWRQFAYRSATRLPKGFLSVLLFAYRFARS